MVSSTRTTTHLIILVALIIAALLPLHTTPLAAQSDTSDTRPLEGPALWNVIAFARLVGYVQYFYPGDEAAATDWNRFTVEGMRAVEDAPDPDALVAILQDRFAPVAPLVLIYRAGELSGEVPQPDYIPPETDDLHLVTWYHLGLQTSATLGLYTSERLTKRPDGPPPQEYPDFPAPDAYYAAKLHHSTAATIPLVLWADADGTLPHTGVTPEAPWPTDIWSPDSRATRFAAVALAWNVLQHSYPYFDVVDVSWPGVLAESLQRAATDTGLYDFMDTLNWMVAQLQDGHGYVTLAPSIMGSIIPNQHLPFAAAWIEDQPVITYVWPGAEGALQPGDVLLALDGRPVSELMDEYGTLVSAATPQLRHMRTLNALLWHDPGTAVELTIRHISGAEEQVHVTADLPGSDYFTAFYAGITTEARPADPISELEPGIWYLDVTRAQGSTFAVLLPDLYGSTQGLIIDLRGYPAENGIGMGTLLSLLSDREECEYLWMDIPRVIRPDQADLPVMHRLDMFPFNQRPLAAPHIVVMTDARAISYAETLLMEIRHCTDATIIGGPSAGTNGNTNLIELPGGFIVSWTGMAVRWHDGSQFHGIGVLPDVPVERTRQGVIEGRDEVLDAALDMVRE